MYPAKQVVIVRKVYNQYTKLWEPMLIFPDVKANVGYLLTWMEVGQHSEASISYIRYHSRVCSAEETTKAVQLYAKTYNTPYEDFCIRHRIQQKMLQKAWYPNTVFA